MLYNDLKHINISLIKKWCINRLTEIVDFRDDGIAKFICNHLTNSELNLKKIFDVLKGYLHENMFFFKELEKHMRSSKQNYQFLDLSNKKMKLGIPQQMIDDEMAKQKTSREKIIVFETCFYNKRLGRTT